MQRRTFSAALAAPFLIAAGARPTRASAQNRLKTADADEGLALQRAYALRDDAMRFADEAAARQGVPREWARGAIGQALFNPTSQRLMRPAPRSFTKNWAVYRSRFIDNVRIRAATDFWSANRATLARAQADYGVPPEIIVGIIGVETIYGRNMGNFRVLDALATLTFDFPPEHPRFTQRQAYFAGELGSFLALCHRTNLPPGELLGSYAGAMGMPQFMPSSWLRYAVDYDHDGRIDLAGSDQDAIGSVANYFRGYGWTPGMPTTYPVRLAPEADMASLLEPDILPTFTATEFSARGALPQAGGDRHRGPLALVELQNGDPSRPGNAPTYVAGTENLYVVTRYNHSAYYAMAVIELGEAAAAAMARG
ncbi:MAG: lytic murein transglycosylase B [Burkholderiaceae bacterium]